MHENCILLAVDPGIRPVVEALRAEKLPTFASCQGGAEHSFSRPTVRIAANRIYKTLRKSGFDAFYVKPYYSHNGEQNALRINFWEVDFWHPPNEQCKVVHVSHINEDLQRVRYQLYALHHEVIRGTELE